MGHTVQVENLDEGNILDHSESLTCSTVIKYMKVCCVIKSLKNCGVRLFFQGSVTSS